MTSSPRSLLSLSSGLVLVASIGISLVTTGTASLATVLGFSGLVVWALVHMFMLEFPTRRPALARKPSLAAQPVRVPARIMHVGVPALVEFARSAPVRRQAA